MFKLAKLHSKANWTSGQAYVSIGVETCEYWDTDAYLSMIGTFVVELGESELRIIWKTERPPALGRRFGLTPASERNAESASTDSSTGCLLEKWNK